MGTDNSNTDYAGDVDCNRAWQILTGDPKAQLIDVRTRAEWTFVGTPDLSGTGRRLLAVEWQMFPSMNANPDFVAQASQLLEQAGAGKTSPVLCLCRSGGRSRAAAIALTAAGYSQAYNVAGGFEGDLDGEQHRGALTGWKAQALPWCQS